MAVQINMYESCPSSLLLRFDLSIEPQSFQGHHQRDCKVIENALPISLWPNLFQCFYPLQNHQKLKSAFRIFLKLPSDLQISMIFPRNSLRIHSV